MSKEEYKPKSILFTGGAGFIGSNVMSHIVDQHPETQMVCLDSLDYCANPKNFQHLLDRPNFIFVQGNILSKDLVRHLLKVHEVDTVMHFAAQTHVDNSFGNSFKFTETNVLGTHVLLEACKFVGAQIRRFIHVSTDEVYGESTADDDRNTESRGMDPTNPYAASKAAAEFIVKSYRVSFNLPIIITRGNNVYGRHQFPEKLIPKFVTLLSRGKSCPLHGDGSNRRSFLHVDDVAKAFDIVLRRGELGKVYNIGAKEEFTNLKVLEMLLEIFNINDRESYITFVRDRAFNDFRYHIDTSSLEELGWKQEIDFKVGLKDTVDWYLRHPTWWEPASLTTALQAHPTAPNATPSTPVAGPAADEPPAKKLKI